MDNMYIITCLALLFLIILGTRALPFLFAKPLQNNVVIKDLGAKLPGCIMVLLVLHNLETVNFKQYPFGLSELVSIAFVVLIHLYKRNMILSIFAGTALYISLNQIL